MLSFHSITARLLALLALSSGIFPCVVLAETALPRAFPNTDCKCTISAPDNWATRQDASTSASVKIGAGDLYLNVWTSAKEDYIKNDLKSFAEAQVKEMLGNLSEGSSSQPLSLTINGLNALQYEVFGGVDNMRVGYLYTIIEGKDHFYRVLAWSLKSRFPANKALFQQMSASLKVQP